MSSGLVRTRVGCSGSSAKLGARSRPKRDGADRIARGTDSPRITHSCARTFSCDRSSRVRPCARTNASDPSPLTTESSSLALRSISNSDVFRDWGIVGDAQLGSVFRKPYAAGFRAIDCDAKFARGCDPQPEWVPVLERNCWKQLVDHAAFLTNAIGGTHCDDCKHLSA